MTDVYAWWRKALEMGGGRELTRDQLLTLSLSEGHPEAGFYRKRMGKDGRSVPVAIWPDEAGGFHCLVGDYAANAIDEWTYLGRWPISEAVYRAVRGGAPWPEEPPAPKDHNQVKTGDPCKDLQAEYDAEREMAEAFLKKPIATQDQADQAAVWSKKLAAIAKKATDLHKVEKQPSLDEGRRIDDKWRGLKEDPAALAKRLKRHLDDWLIAQARIEEERQRKAREEADRIRREAEEAAARAAEASRKAEEERQRREQQNAGSVGSLFSAEADAEADRLEQERERRLREAEDAAKRAADAEREAAARNAAAGRTGAKVSLHTYYLGAVDDYDAALLAVKNEPEIREAVEKIVNRIARNKDAPMPAGTRRVEDRRAA